MMLETWTAMVGGGEEATFIRYNDHVIVFAFGFVGCYESEDAFWDGNAIWIKEG